MRPSGVLASSNSLDNYIPIFEKLRGLDIFISKNYIEMEKKIAHLLSEDDRRNYVNNLLYASLGHLEYVTVCNIHDLGEKYGSKFFTVNWKQYFSFVVKQLRKN